jgi:hypothetical protein
MRFFLFAFAFIIAVSAPAFAEGELFVKKHQSGKSSAYTATPKKPDEIPSEDYYVSKALANSYYKNCVSTNHPILTGDSLQALCACTAAKLTEEMTVNEIEALFSNAPESQDARHKMLTSIYAPCMEYPVSDLITGNCMKNDELQRVVSNKAKLCGCIGNRMGAYIGKNASGIITTTLRDNPNVSDPLASFFQSPNFQILSRQHLQACVAEDSTR